MASAFTGEEVLAATGGTLLSGSIECRIRRVSTDSRTVRKGDLFVALRGDRVDGHRFVGGAFRQGAKGALIEAASANGSAVRRSLRASASVRGSGPLMVTVRDSLRAYQDLAAFHRKRFHVPVIAVTGSNGKTTTKEMVGNTLSQRWRLLQTVGNLNNRIGLPHTVLRLTAAHQVAVLELGVDAEGQTTRLANVARPTIGIITNVGRDHLEFFGDVDGSARAKAELVPVLPDDGVLILNADDPYYRYFRRRARCAVVSFGVRNHADVRGSDVRGRGTRVEFRLQITGRQRPHRVSLALPGTHNVSNALAAAAVGHVLGLSMTKITKGLSRVRPVGMRSRVCSWRGITIIQDCYNANPDSMKAAVTLLKNLGEATRTIAVLADMLELGADAKTLHREVGAHVADSRISFLIACGALGKDVARGAAARGMSRSRIIETPRVREAAPVLRALAEPGDVVLLKASRGMKMEDVLDALTRQASG